MVLLLRRSIVPRPWTWRTWRRLGAASARCSLNSWASAIKSKAAASSPVEALRLYTRMQRQSVPFDSFSILFTLKSCTTTNVHLPHNNLGIIRHLHAHLLKLGFSAHVYVATSLLCAYASSSAASLRDACALFDEMPKRNTVTWNVMITSYSRRGDFTTARILFDAMPHRNLASWSAMITAYMDHALWEQGFALFRQLLTTTHNDDDDDCLKPDQLTVGSVLAGCGRMGSSGLILGRSIHGFTIKNEWELNVELGTCLVNMYARCGVLKTACQVFDMMRVVGNVVAWTALICGAAQHGYSHEALLIFNRMRDAGVQPNELTFTGVLTACAQAGLVDEGRSYYRMMVEEGCGLRPTIQHYGCMVDLFGKAGLLGEAYEVINTMPFEPNVVVWGSFLSSCKLYRQFEIAEKVIHRVMGMVRPENDGGIYSLISDLYALSGRWSEVEELRTMMLSGNVRKVRGSSFITSVQ